MFKATQPDISVADLQLAELYLKAIGFQLIKNFWMRGQRECAVIRPTPSKFKISIGVQV